MKVSEVSYEVTYQIPQSEAAHFRSFFEQFDTRMSEYDVTSYGISLATLEDVFMEVNGGGKDKTSRLQAIEEQR